jgi:uncharacterized protein involved in exopolysaccharide biosynthesis
VNLRQQVYNSLEQSREEARIREVRDIPVITVLETPRIPVIPEPRGSLFKMIAGGATATILGILFALVMNALSELKRDRSPAAQEFSQLVREATPALLRRGAPHATGTEPQR